MVIGKVLMGSPETTTENILHVMAEASNELKQVVGRMFDITSIHDQNSSSCVE